MTIGGTVPDFDHFLLTRFNARSGPARAGDEWLRHRLGFFESLCHSSVAAQTVDNFKWLVFFDAERDQWFQDEVDRLSAGVFEPVWVDGGLTTEFIAEAVASRSSAPWVITTRMDNDDAVARDFIERIQQEFAHQDAEFINFSSGLQLTEDGALYAWTEETSPFISFVEKRGEALPKTVHIAGHDKLRHYGPIRQVAAHPMWVQMVHAKNMANAVRGVRIDPSPLANHFTIGREAAPIGALSLRFAQVRNTAGLAKRVLSDPRRIRKAARILRAKIAR